MYEDLMKAIMQRQQKRAAIDAELSALEEALKILTAEPVPTVKVVPAQPEPKKGPRNVGVADFVRKSLADGPKSLAALHDRSGFTRQQIRDSLRKAKWVREVDGKYELCGEKRSPGGARVNTQHIGQAHRVRAFLSGNSGATLSQIATGTGLTVKQVYNTCYAAKDITKNNGRYHLVAAPTPIVKRRKKITREQVLALVPAGGTPSDVLHEAVMNLGVDSRTAAGLVGTCVRHGHLERRGSLLVKPTQQQDITNIFDGRALMVYGAVAGGESDYDKLLRIAGGQADVLDWLREQKKIRVRNGSIFAA